MKMQKLDLAGGEKLSLTNDGNLEVFFIGVGSAFAESHYQTNYLIIKGDHHVMVDFGMDGPRALLGTAGLKATEIGCILPTHSHDDHANGISSLALRNRYIGIPFMKRPKLKMIISEEYQRVLWTHTLQGALEWNEEAADSGHKMQMSDYFEIVRPAWMEFRPREVFTVNYGSIHLEIFRTCHIPETSCSWEASFISYGVFIDGRVFVSGDTKYDPELIRMYKHAEIMFQDVQFFPGAVHAPLTNLRNESDEVKAKMHFIHYADNWDKQDISGFGGWTQQGVRYIFD